MNLPDRDIEQLRSQWQLRISDFRACAEEHFFGKSKSVEADRPWFTFNSQRADKEASSNEFHSGAERHMEACCRFTEHCLREFDEMLEKNKPGPEPDFQI